MAQTENDGVLHADPNDVGVYEIESLCMNCHDNASAGDWKYVNYANNNRASLVSYQSRYLSSKKSY
jgi:hypothetical protein